jgi:hypothetical protein
MTTLKYEILNIGYICFGTYCNTLASLTLIIIFSKFLKFSENIFVEKNKIVKEIRESLKIFWKYLSFGQN